MKAREAIIVTDRKPEIDILKGILIIFVVLGHSLDWKYAQYIFQFHMSLFFIISGYLYRTQPGNYQEWCLKKIRRFMIPYFSWFMLISVVGLNSFSLKSVILLLYGGRVLAGSLGTWWFSTVSLLTLLIVSCLERKIRNRKALATIVAACYILAFVESYLLIPANNADFTHYQDFPWNIDVCLISIPLFFTGICIRKNKNGLARLRKRRVLSMSLIFLVVFETVITIFNCSYVVDLKYSHYGNILLLIPVCLAWGYILYSISTYINEDKKRWNPVRQFLILCGKLSYPIMFLHMGLVQKVKTMSLNAGIIFIIALVISYFVSFAFSKNKYTNTLFVTGR